MVPDALGSSTGDHAPAPRYRGNRPTPAGAFEADREHGPSTVPHRQERISLSPSGTPERSHRCQPASPGADHE